MGLERQVVTGTHRAAVDQHRASPAHLRLAGALGSREPQSKAEKFKQGFLDRHLTRPRIAVDCDRQLECVLWFHVIFYSHPYPVLPPSKGEGTESRSAYLPF